MIKHDAKNTLLFTGSLLAAVFSLIGAAGSILLGLAGFFSGGTVTGYSAWVLAGTFVGLFALSLPAGWSALRAMRGDNLLIPKPSRPWLYGILFSFPIVLAVGAMAFSGDILPVILGPPAHLLAALLPVVLMLMIVIDRSPAITQRRGWGHFLAGLWLSPISAFSLELIAAIPIILSIVVGLNARLGDDFLLRIWEQPVVVPQDTLQALLELLNQPIYLVLILSYLGILVPLIEEMIKSIGLLPLMRRKISDSEGFLGGVLAGAGYGLFEALYLGQPGPGWAALMLARAGATMMHMLTAGLTGIGFARARRLRRTAPFLRYYLMAVGLHAMWNVAAVVMGIGFAREALENPGISTALGNSLAIAGGMLLLMLSSGAYLGLRKLPAIIKVPEEPHVHLASEVESSSGL